MDCPAMEATPMPERYRVVNTHGAPCVLKGGGMDTRDEQRAIKSAVWWDSASPTHAPHRVEAV
jgi:hypothetical protein